MGQIYIIYITIDSGQKKYSTNKEEKVNYITFSVHFYKIGSNLLLTQIVAWLKAA